MSDLLTPEGDIADAYRSFIAKSRYSRWIDQEQRRETWKESVDRYMNFMVGHLARTQDYVPPTDLLWAVRSAILNHDIVPSMRALMTAGEALERSHIAGYNCAYLPLADAQAFDELLYILMNGTGVGFSVERQYVNQLPPVPARIEPGLARETIHVADSKEGWAHAFGTLLSRLWRGVLPEWTLDAVRPAGARLETFGGRASGPDPLDDLFRFTVELFLNARGRQLRPIEAHDLACKVASVVVVGGVRRSAMISLSDLTDREMAQAKSGEWWVDHPYRALANISAVYENGVTEEEFATEWKALVASGSGERGIFNRDAAMWQAARNGRRDVVADFGTNPCSEIILRPFEFCNLSEVVVRPEDTLEYLEVKVMLAAILGTWQSTLTDFPYLREEWKRNAEEERLLGVSLTGVFGSALTDGRDRFALEAVLGNLKNLVIASNEIEAKNVGIAPSAATTCVKPSGTVSQLAGVSSGLHPWHSEYYIRTVRGDKKDPLSQLMVEAGVPHEEDLTSDTTWVFSFPVKAPPGALTRRDLRAVEHLEIWLSYQRAWCEHKPSVTVSVREDEWSEVGEWVLAHLDEVSGVSFLPYSEHTYQQAPYQECSREQYEEMAARMPVLQWSDLVFYETQDGTTGSQELACSAAEGCESVDLIAA
ncbi:hypothetical protein [Streptomyces sp. NPDC017448]|uniref:hypothetical protein n=1 Tax=Streptomyces sp. NPDC017448 TaxID=3364996 RepID=UPI0037B311C8